MEINNTTVSASGSATAIAIGSTTTTATTTTSTQTPTVTVTPTQTPRPTPIPTATPTATLPMGTLTSSDLIDTAQDEYFRLFEDRNDDTEDLEEASKYIIGGIWNPTSNLTSMNESYVSQSPISLDETASSGTTSTAIETDISSYYFSSVSASASASASAFSSSSPSSSPAPSLTSSSLFPVSYALNETSNDLSTVDDGERQLFSTIARTVTDATAAASVGSNNYGDEEDIALIDSAETVLGGDTDYGVVAFNGGEESLLHHSIAFDMGKGRNDSFHHNFDGGGGGSVGGSVGAGVSVDIAGSAGQSAGDGVVGVSDDKNGGSTFMLLLEDFGEYFYNYNGSTVTGNSIINTNITDLNYRTNCTNLTSSSASSASCYDLSEVDHNYWALILILFPILTLFGNILVILSVCRERSLQTVTNYFIVSLAIADLLVAVVVMPFAVYVLFNGIWALPNFVCDFYIAMDVICSTSSIFNLVAISIDRYIAVTQPIKYARHRNSRRVCLTILLVWAISAAIGSPIVLGLNNTPHRDPDLCVFYNTDFILYSSLSSFYIPCIIMVFLYWNIFKALRSRARKQRAARKPHLSELTGGSVIENIAQTRRLAETALDSSRHAGRILPDEAATNTASGSNEEEDENAISPDIDDCHVIVNDKSTEFMLATVVEETGNVVAQITSQPQLVVSDPNGAADSSPPDSPVPSATTLKRSSVSSGRRNTAEGSPKREPALSVAMKPLSFVRYGVQEAMTLARNDSTLSTTSKTSSRKDKKNSQASRFTIYKVHKASKKKREKSSAKKERKATKTLAIVLGVFLFCWVPFFTCNIMDAMCAKFEKDCRPGVTAFILTTWLGYINSFVNPVIYTIFNPEFRKAFKKIMHMG